MKDPTDRLCRDAIYEADKIELRWYNGESIGSISSADHEFAVDMANAFARLCDRREREREKRISPSR